MSHKGTDLGEFLHHHGILPPQLEEDANVFESFLPTAFVEEIDEVEDFVDDLVASKKRKRGTGEPVPTKLESGTYTMRRRPPAKYSSLAKKVNRVACCVDTETHMHDTDIATSLTTGTLTTYAINNPPQGDNITNRTGNMINGMGIALSINGSSITGPVEIFVIRPTNSNTAPVATDFSYSTGPGKLLNPGRGWTIRKITLDPVYRKHVDIFIPLRLKSMFLSPTGSSQANGVFLCISNDSGSTQSITGIARYLFKG